MLLNITVNIVIKCKVFGNGLWILMLFTTISNKDYPNVVYYI